MSEQSPPLLTVKNLTLSTKNDVAILKDVSFEIKPNERVALVGKSGSGKSAIAHAILRLFSKQFDMTLDGNIKYQGHDLLKASDKDMQGVRGSQIAMIFQEALTALNPTMTIGDQILEAVLTHKNLSKAEAEQRVLELIAFVGLTEPKKRVRQYPHEFSGGMRQRIAIAIALACEPKLLIADEPTTALDVTIQAQVLDLLRKIQIEKGMSILLITHDLAIVAGFCERVLILNEGEIVDEGTVDDIFYESNHPYTRLLLESVKNHSKKVECPLA